MLTLRVYERQNMHPIRTWVDRVNCGRESYMGPYVKPGGICLQVVDVLLRCEKVLLVLRDPEVGKGRQVFG